MQFSCDSCKAQLQIADEKVRGKRLVVRCKRCGAKITITDPALAGKNVVARPVQPAAPAPSAPPAPAPAPAASAPPTPPSVTPAAVAPAQMPPEKPQSDTESTVAMDSEVLEKALEASKTENPDLLNANAARAQTAPAGDPSIWFAMLHGKQTGPMTRAELTAKTGTSEIGPRTYLWREGMDAWQRAREIAELSALFPSQPEPSAPSPVLPVPEAKPQPEPQKLSDSAEENTSKDPMPLGEQVHQQDIAKELFPSGEMKQPSPQELAGWAASEMSRQRPLETPIENTPAPAAVPADTTDAPRFPSERPMFESAAPPRSRLPLAIFIAVLLAAAATIVWVFFGSDAKKEGDAPPAPTEAVLDAGAAAPTSPPDASVAPAATPDASVAPAAAPVGLTADQVRKKLDENKGALQSCIDEALHKDPNLRVGKIHIATTIAPSGQVTTAKIDKKTVDESALGRCLKSATKKIAFPPFGGDAFDVDIPIVVTAGE